MKKHLPFAAPMAVVTLVIWMSSPLTSAQSRLGGVWKVVEMTTGGPEASTVTNIQPGLILATKTHYSITMVNVDKPRPAMPSRDETDLQKRALQLVAVWCPFSANAGTYEVKGTTLITHPLVGKNPDVMVSGSFMEWEFKLEGNNLWLTPRSNSQGFANTARIKLQRLE
jgi:hypothetical protein